MLLCLIRSKGTAIAICVKTDTVSLQTNECDENDDVMANGETADSGWRRVDTQKLVTNSETGIKPDTELT